MPMDGGFASGAEKWRDCRPISLFIAGSCHGAPLSSAPQRPTAQVFFYTTFCEASILLGRLPIPGAPWRWIGSMGCVDLPHSYRMV